MIRVSTSCKWLRYRGEDGVLSLFKYINFNLFYPHKKVGELNFSHIGTEVGIRGGESDRETGWEQRADQAGEKLLGR